MKKKYSVVNKRSEQERSVGNSLLSLMKDSPIPKDEILSNLGLYIDRPLLSRMLFMSELYKKVLDVHGVIFEFGVRWGQNLVLFENFRGMFEPFNYNRKIVGFDTFEGFPTVSDKDKNLTKGDYGVTENYEGYLDKLLACHETMSPINHIKKYDLVKGDAVKTLPQYLRDNPETMIALCYFDFDLYEPTKKCLEMILPHLVKGAVIGFDELNMKEFAGETIALKEVLGLNKFKVQRSVLSPLQSYIVYDEGKKYENKR